MAIASEGEEAGPKRERERQWLIHKMVWCGFVGWPETTTGYAELVAHRVPRQRMYPLISDALRAWEVLLRQRYESAGSPAYQNPNTPGLLSVSLPLRQGWIRECAAANCRPLTGEDREIFWCDLP
jgi:hypothetical protein